MKFLHKISQDVERLSYLELVKLDEIIHRLLDQHAVEDPEIRQREDREVIERQKVGRITYQLERIRCGKPNCKCAKGALHGPYWYGYWSEGARPNQCTSAKSDNLKKRAIVDGSLSFLFDLVIQYK